MIKAKPTGFICPKLPVEGRRKAFPNHLLL